MGEVHKEAVADEILTGKKASAAELQLHSLTTRHDEVQKRLNEKEQQLVLHCLPCRSKTLISVELLCS